MNISAIYIYPIKSLGGFPVSSAKLSDRGLQYDRRFILVDGNGQMLTQRQQAIMALLKTNIVNETIEVWHKDDPSNKIAFPTTPVQFQGEQNVVVWGTECLGVIMPEPINQWFQQQLGIPCTLLYMPDHSKRLIKQKYHPNGEWVNFADGVPILLIGQSSLDDLNQRLEFPVSMKRFRPNLVFTGGQPFEEDHWNQFTIKEINFKVSIPCVRCNIPNINQKTAAIEKEPNRTLATFRRFDRNIHFGVNVIGPSAPLPHWEINVGDILLKS